MQRRHTRAQLLVPLTLCAFGCGSTDGPFRFGGSSEVDPSGGTAGAGGLASTAGGASGGATAPTSGGNAGGPALGGTGGVTDTPPNCDDDNPCTEDGVSEGECESVPLADGTPCDDGELCTLGDECVSGACVSGQPVTGDVEELARLNSFGTQGVVSGGDGRYVFFEASGEDVLFTLVRMLDDQVTVLDTEHVSDLIFIDYQHAAVPAAYLGDGLVGIATDYSDGVKLLDVSSDSIVVRPQLLLPYDVETPHPRSFTRQGDRLWVCANTFFFGGILYLGDLSDPEAPEVTATFSVPTCGAVAGSPDGERLYLNTSGGVYPIDVSHVDDDGLIEAGDIIAPNSGLAIVGSRLLLREPDRVEIWNEADWSVQTTILGATTGSALLEDRLFIQGARTTEDGVENFLSLYDVSGEAALLDDLVLETDAGSLPSWAQGQSARLAADYAHAIHYNTKRVFHVVGESFQELNVPGLGSLQYLGMTGGGAVALGPARAQWIDLLDPTAPSFLENQTLPSRFAYTASPVVFDSLTAGQIHWGYGSLSSPDQVELYGPTRMTGVGPTVPIRKRKLALGAEAQETQFQIARNDVLLHPEGDDLYRLVLPPRGTVSARLERFALDALPEAGEDIGPPLDALEFQEEIEDLLPNSWPSARFDVDAAAQTAIVSLSATHDDSTGEGFLYWLDLSVSPPVVVEKTPFEQRISALRVSGDRAALILDPVVCCNAELVFLQRELGQVADFGDNPDLGSVSTLLAFDSHALYAGSGGDYYGGTLYVIPWGPADGEISMFPLLTRPTSVTSTPTGIVVGSQNELVTLHPYCLED